MVEPQRRRHIAARLDAAEEEHGVTILYACESGSRAWGFPSEDSDYDVRVVYVHSRDWYLSIDLEQHSDTIDPPTVDNIDLHGWDLRKALRLFRTANPTLMDWLQSPIVYRADEEVLHQWRALMPDYYTRRAAGHAYRGMAQSVAEQNLDDEPIPHKAYLYVLRALLAVRWVEQERGPVPVEFERLLDATVDERSLRNAIDALVTRKRNGTEHDEGPRLPVIHDFIDQEQHRHESLDLADSASRPGPEPLNALFRRVLARRADPPGH